MAMIFIASTRISKALLLKLQRQKKLISFLNALRLVFTLFALVIFIMHRSVSYPFGIDESFPPASGEFNSFHVSYSISLDFL